MSNHVNPKKLVNRARDGGVELAILDGAIEWYPHEPPKRPLGSSDITIDELMGMCEAFEVRSISALAPFPTTITIQEMAEHFSALCFQAAKNDLRVHFEFTPKSPISDISSVWELIKLADQPNGGILFDTWHFFRVNPDFETLAKIPGERIFAVQVSDGGTDYVEGLLQDTFRHRLLPGKGVFDLVRVVQALGEIGALSNVGPEVLSTELFALPPIEAARQAAESFDQLVHQVENARQD